MGSLSKAVGRSHIKRLTPFRFCESFIRFEPGHDTPRTIISFAWITASTKRSAPMLSECSSASMCPRSPRPISRVETAHSPSILMTR